MRMQASQHDCGPTALMNALRAIGIDRGIDELRKLTKATATAGTSERKLVTGIQKIQGVRPHPHRFRDPTLAIAVLRDRLRCGRPCILSVDEEEHWVAAVGLLGERVLVADSASADLVIAYTPERLLSRWDAGSEQSYYAIVLEAQ